MATRCAEQGHGADAVNRAAHAQRSGGHASRVRQNAALTSFAAWFAPPSRRRTRLLHLRGGRQACGLPSPAQVSAAFGFEEC